MSSIVQALALALIVSGQASTQPVDDVRIVVTGFTLLASGAEKSAEIARVADARIGAPTSAVFAMEDCGYFSVTAAPFAVYPGPDPFLDGATYGWRLEVTPVRVVDHVVTFRLRWARVLDKGNAGTTTSEDIELTLKPGESRPIDSVLVASKAATMLGRPCNVKSASLRVSAEFSSLDRRLIGADVWLVERLPGGKEQSQLQSVRGMPHLKMPFHFDRVPHGAGSADFSGHVVAEPYKGEIMLDLETIRAVPDPGQDGYQAARWFRSRIRVVENEIVEVALNDGGRSPTGSAFSLRIRAKRLR